MDNSVYLAGPITGLSFGTASSWRDNASLYLREYGIVTFSPLRGGVNLIHEPCIKDRYEESVLHTQKAFTTRDRWDVSRCDLLFVNLLGAKEISVGSVGEIFWADAFRKPIVLAMEKKNVHQRPIIRELAGFIVEDFDTAIQTIADILISG